VSGWGKREKGVECRALNAAINEGERERGGNLGSNVAVKSGLGEVGHWVKRVDMGELFILNFDCDLSVG
jgi:hypothetical protein